MENFNCKNITIFFIDEGKAIFHHRFSILEEVDYKIISISYYEFFEQADFIKNIFLKNKIELRKCIFIFKNRALVEITTKFKTFNIIISGGSNTKRHMLSPNQFGG